MNDVARLLDYYTNEDYELFTYFTKPGYAKDHDAAAKFLSKYWLSDEEYKVRWETIQHQFFTGNDSLEPELVYKDGFHILANSGGCLFAEEDFLKLQNCMLAIGETHFVIIQRQTYDGRPLCYLKFPVNISWAEMLSGDFVAMSILGFSGGAYMVFGDSGVWAKYAGNDYDLPLDIYAFKFDYKELFEGHFKPTILEEAQILEWMPEFFKYYKAKQELDK